MILLFTIILIEKGGHQHESNSNSSEKNQESIVVSPGCLICDYQLAADTDLPPQNQTAAFTTYPSCDEEIIVYNLTSFHRYQLSERGPPALSPICYT